MALTLRSNKGSNLTSNEVDNNFTTLSGSISNIINGTTLVASSSYAMNGGGGGAIEFYGNGTSYGSLPKVNFFGPGVMAYSSEMDPEMFTVNVGAGLDIYIPDVANYTQIREFEYTSGSLSFLPSDNYPGYFRAIVNMPNLTSVSSDVLPTTDGVHDLGSPQKKWFDGYFTNNVAVGDINLTNDLGSLVIDTDVVTTAVSADIANIGSINIIEDTITVDTMAPVDEYSITPPMVKIGSGLKILGSTYGSKYVLVNGNGTPEENAAELQMAYDYIKELRSINPAVDNNDRFTLVISPGYYLFSTEFTIDASNIDVVSLTGGLDVLISTTKSDIYHNHPVIVKDIENATIRGINTGTLQFRTEVYDANVLIENCKGGDFSFAIGNSADYAPDHYGTKTVRSTFKKCEGGNYSFHPYTISLNAKYMNCKGGNKSFGIENGGNDGTYSTYDSIYIDCEAGDQSFLSYTRGGIISGTFDRCIGGDQCFASSPHTQTLVQAVFTNCSGGAYSFGVGNILQGDGKFIGCLSGHSSFFVGGSGTNNGMVINCVAKQGAGSLFASSGQGIIRNCINANGTLVNS